MVFSAPGGGAHVRGDEPNAVDPKDLALKALARRRVYFAKTKPVDNSRLPAGSPMYFNCKECNAPFAVPELYIERPQHCTECRSLIDSGWL